MKGWATKPLGEVLELSRTRIEPADHAETSFNYVGLESMQGHSGRLLLYQPTRGADIKSTKNVFQPGEILYGKLRPYLNKVHLASAGGICSTDIYVLRPIKEQMHPSFAANYLRSPKVLEMVSNAMAGANLPRIGQEALLSIPVPVPPLHEQARIVNLLDEADELRTLRAQADRRTADLIPAVFENMFGRRDSSWSMSTLGAVVEEFRYGTSNKATGQGRPILRIPNVVAQAVNLDDLKLVPVTADEFDRLRLIDGDLLFVRTNGNPNYVGRCAVFDAKAINEAGHDAEGFIYASYLIRARLKTGVVLPAFVQHYLTSPEGARELRSRSKTSAGQYNINTEGLGNIPLLVPPLHLQKMFSEQIAEIREFEAGQMACGARLDALFQAILHRAFQGEL